MSTHASKRGRALSGKPFASHRADRDFASTILSVLAGAHSVGAGALAFFSTREARALRLVCTELLAAVASCPWADAKTRVARRLDLWRASFPRARAANVSAPTGLLVDADFAHLAGVRTLVMRNCDQAAVTDAAYAHLAGVQTLDMAHCRPGGHHGRGLCAP